jgi:hypothetical protein
VIWRFGDLVIVRARDRQIAKSRNHQIAGEEGANTQEVLFS